MSPRETPSRQHTPLETLNIRTHTRTPSARSPGCPPHLNTFAVRRNDMASFCQREQRRTRATHTLTYRRNPCLNVPDWYTPALSGVRPISLTSASRTHMHVGLLLRILLNEPSCIDHTPAPCVCLPTPKPAARSTAKDRWRRLRASQQPGLRIVYKAATPKYPCSGATATTA